MIHFCYGILLMVVVLPLLQSVTSYFVTLFDYWSTAIAAKSVRINNQLEKENAEIQLDLQERQLESQERPPAIGFHCFDAEAVEMEDDE